MALEAVVFSQDPLTSYSCYKEYSNLYNFGSYDFGNYYHYSSKLEDDDDKPYVNGIFDDATINNNNNNNNNNYDYSKSNASPSEILQNNHQWDHHQQYHVNSSYSSPEGGQCTTTVKQYFSGEAPPVAVSTSPAETGGGRRKRRRRSCKNKEEVEHQRMTHIAVERNRRKQMNEYLAVIRSMMPPSYAQRGDQASIVGGAINYVKELEQVLQSLEAQKTTKRQSVDTSSTGDVNVCNNDDVASPETGSPAPQLFSDFFTFPQYSNRSTTTSTTSQLGSNSVSSNSAVGEIEVTMVDSHANVKILAKKQSKQLLKLVAGFQGLRLSVLHLNVTTADSLVLYSFSVKIEEGCQLNSVDDIAAATNHILRQIREEAIGLA